MRQKRTKAYRKLMAMYELSFGFRQPYQVLVDSGMCLDAQDHKIDLLKQLETVVQGRIKPMITQCSIVELYKMGKERQAAVDLAKGFERRKCNHREAIEGNLCLKGRWDKNKHRYVVASQSPDLRIHLRMIQAVPIVQFKKAVMILEPPTKETLRVKAEMVEDALKVPENEKDALPLIESTDRSFILKPHRKAKGPNPLSVKKKQPKLQTSDDHSAKPNGSPKQDKGGTIQKRMREEDEAEGEEPTVPKKKRRRRKKTEDDEPALADASVDVA